MLKFRVPIRTLVEIRTDDSCEFCDKSCPRMLTKSSNTKAFYYCCLEEIGSLPEEYFGVRSPLKTKKGIPIRCSACKEKLEAYDKDGKLII